MINYGKWVPYTRTFEAGDPPFFANVIWLKNTENTDWYEFVKELPLDGTYCLVTDEGKVQVADNDPTKLVPHNLTLICLDETHADPKATVQEHYISLATGELTTPPVDIPQAVSASSAEVALYNAGLLDQVRAMVDTHPYEPVRIYFTKANSWQRSNPYVQALGAELGLSDADIDSLFVEAAKLD